MATAVDICNLALGNIGARTQVTSIAPPDGSAEAGTCARFFELAKRTILSGPHSFSVARARATLAEVTNTSDSWTYAYALPADCLKPRRVLSLTESTGESPEVRGAPFTVEGKVLFTHQQDAVLIYTKDVTDPGLFDPEVVEAIAARLSGMIAGPIIKGDVGAKLSVAWADRAAALTETAVLADANGAAQQQHEFETESLVARR